MKKKYLLILFFITAFTQAQIVNIPDAEFKNALVNTNCVDTNGDGIGDSDADLNDDGEIQVSEAEAVLWLDVNDKDIASLEGIERFTSLEYLNCSWNDLTTLDVTQNPSLQDLNCSNNYYLTSLNVTQNPNLEYLNCSRDDLISLDLTANVNLIYLDCSWNALTNLDVTQNPNLEYLDCSRINSLTSLDFAQNLNLVEVNCLQNSLTSLDFTQTPNLVILICGLNDLTSLNITQNPNLEYLSCGSNPLTSLDLTQNPNLVVLYCTSNGLTSLDVTQNPNLEFLACGANQLTSLDVSQNTSLRELNCVLNDLTSLDVSQNPNLNTVWCLLNNLTSLNLKNGHNQILTSMRATFNPLNCIQVDDEVGANNGAWPYSQWDVGSQVIYSEDCSLGLEDNNSIGFIMYPNPAQNVLYIQSKEKVQNIKIYSLQGQLIKEGSNYAVNVSALSTGLYFAAVSIEGKTITKKFIKS